MELIAILVAGTSFLFFFAISRLYAGVRLRVDQRVATLTRGEKPGDSLSRRFGQSVKLKSKIKPVQFVAHLEDILRRGEIELSGREFVARFLLLTASLSLIGLLLWGFAGVLLAVILAAGVTAFYLRMRVQKRLQRFNDGLHDMLTLVSSSLRSGHSFVQAMHVVCLDMQGPIRDEFERIEAEMQVGVGVEEAMQRANERVGSEDFDLIVTAITIQRQVGGNLSEVLDKIAETIRERVQLKREVKALTSQGRMSAWIFLLLPIGVAALLYSTDPAYIGLLFKSPVGWGLLTAAVLGQGIGYIFIRKIINVEL